jgi:hypothetical protein
LAASSFSSSSSGNDNCPFGIGRALSKCFLRSSAEEDEKIAEAARANNFDNFSSYLERALDELQSECSTERLIINVGILLPPPTKPGEQFCSDPARPSEPRDIGRRLANSFHL